MLDVAEKWGVWATAIGEVTASETEGQPGRLVISWNDHVVVDVPPGSLADDGPVYARPMREPADLILLQADRAETLPRPSTGDELRETVLRMVASPNLCDKTWVTEQYDRYVLGNTVLAQPEDAGVLRIDERTGLGVALSVDGNGRYARLDPYEGAKLALAEAYRNVAVTGAEPAAVTDCLNFGSPEDPAVMWQFAEAVRGLADGCLRAGHPGHRRQRQLLQPDRRRGDPPDPGGRRARHPRRRGPAGADGLPATAHRRRRPALPARRHRSASCPARSGPG